MRKRLDKRLMKRKFVEACIQLMEEKGHDKTSLRDVAKLAGYNQATVYNYFANVDHLKFYAAMRLTRDYYQSLVDYVADAKDSMDRFLLIWESFCVHAFRQPELFQYRFYLFVGDENDDIVEGYYEDFPEDFQPGLGSSITEMLTRTNITDRAMALVDDLILEGYIRQEDREKFNDLILILFEGVFLRVLNKRIDKETALRRLMGHIIDATSAYLQKPYDFDAFKAGAKKRLSEAET